ncbi:MAG: NAD-dependent epimerase/dehydratase family protein [Cyclobacteriaceae bacterium]
MRTALIAGASGLIGNELLRKLLATDRYDKVLAVGRKPLAMSHAKFSNLITDFNDPAKVLQALKPDDVYCCLGTTMALAGSKEKFYEVDFQYPLALAKATLALGAKQYLLVSALGANKSSSIYYNRVKGDVEEAIRGVGFRSLHIFRPSLLLGERKDKRPGEGAAKVLYKMFGFAIPEKYKAIPADKVATAMLASAAKEALGVFIHESRDIQ